MSLSYDEWTDALRDGDLLGLTCADCGNTYGTPVAVCNGCGGRDLEATTLPRDGELYSVTTVSVPPVGFEGPYHVGLVQLGDVRLLARVEGETPEIGDAVTFSDVIDVTGEPAPVFQIE